MSAPMRIAINASILGDRPSGLGIYTINVIRELAHIAAPEDRLIVFTGYPEALEGAALDVVRVSRWTQTRYGKAGGVYRFGWTQTRFAAQIRATNVDLVYHTAHHGLLYRVPNTPQVVTVQHDVAVSFEFPEQHRLQYYYFRYFIPRLLEASEAILTTSDYAKHVIADTYGITPEKIHYAHNGYDHRHFVPTDPARGIVSADRAVLERYGISTAPYILVVGATYRHKNLARLLQAFDGIGAIHPEVRLCIAGYRSEYLTELFRLVSADARARIVAFPYVPQADLASFYRSAICLAFPSLHESFGIPCVEAMGSGCPVIAARASSLPEICADAAWYVDPHDPDDMTAALRQMIESASLRSALRARGLERATRFRWQMTARAVYRVLQQTHERAIQRRPRAVARA